MKPGQMAVQSTTCWPLAMKPLARMSCVNRTTSSDLVQVIMDLTRISTLVPVDTACGSGG